MYNSVEPVVTGQPTSTNAYPGNNQYPYPNPGGYPINSSPYPNHAGHPNINSSPYPNQTGYPNNIPPPNNLPNNPNNNVSWVGQNNSSFPPAVQYLTTLDQLLVKQQIEILEVLTGYETANKYAILNTMGQKVFYAVEELDCRPSLCCGNARSFEIKVLDNFGLEVMHIHRPFKCPCCCGMESCLQELEVSSPPGTLIGKVHQDGGCCDAGNFTVYNKDDEVVYRIKGSCCHCECGSDIDFRIYCKNGINEVGKITKQWSGFVQEYATKADNFSVSFPGDVDITIKATLLGALFLIDFIFFEQTKNNRRH